MLNLVQDIQQTSGLTLLFISHDLEVVGHLCDAVVVTYLGRVMERGPSRRVYDEPRHPYTRALLSAPPVPDPKARRNRIVLAGDTPSPLDPPCGCVFRTRCPSPSPTAPASCRPWSPSGRGTRSSASGTRKSAAPPGRPPPSGRSLAVLPARRRPLV
jgi:peptide/nickel transport system ATP-binding protein